MTFKVHLHHLSVNLTPTGRVVKRELMNLVGVRVELPIESE